MRQLQKALTRMLCAVAVVAMTSVIGAGLWRRSSAPTADKDLPVLGTVPAFQFHDQDDKPVTHASLRESPWIADFIFTQCAGPCPLMTAKMAALQTSLSAQVVLVSFSVDPEHDSPAVLKRYAQMFSAEESHWKFLTGDPDAVMAQARGMLLTAIPASAEQPILHDTRFVLVDGRSRIRGLYLSNDPQGITNLLRDAKRLVAESNRSDPAH